MQENPQKGSGYIGSIVLVVVVLAAIGLVGWRVYENLHQHPGPTVNQYQPTIIHHQQFSPTVDQQSTPSVDNGQQGSLSNYVGPEDLASCSGNDLLTSSLADPSMYTSITPLGNTSSYNGNAGHVMPVNHLYLNHAGPPTHANGSPIEPIPLTAPGNIEIFQVTVTDHINSAGVNQLRDNKLYFATCKEVSFWVDHVTDLNPVIAQALTTQSQQSCQSITMDKLTYKSCTYNTDIKLKPSAPLGKGGADFGAVDYRTQAQAFLRPSAQQYLHTVCGLDYFTEPFKTQMYKKLKNTKIDTNGLPDCGTDMWDKPGTIQGLWFLPHAPKSGGGLDPYALAITPLNTDPSQGNIDWGGTIAPADRINYKILSSGLDNRNPSAVSTDGHVYCFDDVSQGYAYAKSVFIQLTDANTLKIQYHAGVCPAKPSLSNPTTYNR